MYGCADCGRTYGSQNSLSRHLHNHRKTKRHVCESCGVVFYRRDLLSRHMKVHGAVEPDAAGRPDNNDSDDTAAFAPNSAGAKGGRKRCHTACTRCRELRVKCSGTDPCVSCLKAGRRCDFDYTSRRVSHPPRDTNTLLGGARSDPQTSPQDIFNFSDCAQRSSQEQFILPPPQDSAAHIHDSLLEATQASHCPTDLPSGDPSAPHLPSDTSLPLVDAVSQQEMMQQMGLYFDSHLVDSVSWPMLHENLYLPMESGAPNIHLDYLDLNTSYLDQPAPLHDHQTAAISAQHLASEDHDLANTDTDMNQVPLEPPSHERVALWVNQTGASGVGPADQSRVVQELIAYGIKYNEGVHSRSHNASFWRNMSPKVAICFQISGLEDRSRLLEHLAGLYLKHFEPLWPLFSPQNLDLYQLHPLLFLVLTSIGAMYADAPTGQYGTMMHNQIRTCLAGPLELDDTGRDFTWLAQARVHSKVAALYFGQPKAFSYAQHLGALIVGQARRMDLFSAAYAETCMRRFRNADEATADHERLAIWLHLEGRRRLAFAIFRAETYTSVLLQKKPLVSLEDIDLSLPSCDAVWEGDKIPPRLCLQIIEYDRMPSRHLRASDIYRVALDRREPLPPLDPIGYELLLFGLQSAVWRFCRDPDLFARLTQSPTVWSTPGEILDDNHSVSAHGPSNTSGVLSNDVLRPGDAVPSELDCLDSSSRQMSDLSMEYLRLISALHKCERSIPLVKAFVQSERDRTSLMSSLILHHLGYLLLHAPVSSLHQIQYRLADGKDLSPDVLHSTYEWANSPRGRLAADRAVSIWSLIVNFSSRQPPKVLKFNLMAFLGLHHAAALLWSYAGACSSLNNPGEEDDVPRLALPATSHPSRKSIVVNRVNTPEVLERFVWAYDMLSPSRWSSFAEAAKALADHPFPAMAAM